MRINWFRLWLSVPMLIGALLSCASCTDRIANYAYGETPVTPATSAVSEELVRVKRVFDGDTILLEDGRTVRYLGMNTPEYQEPFYLKAKQRNESLVKGQEVRLEFDQEKTDGHDRLLAYVYVGDEMVNARLVQEGLAHAFFVGQNRRHRALFLELEAEARQRKAGIWSARGRMRDLKITTVHPADPAENDQRPSYARIANLSDGPITLGGYLLSTEGGHQCRFPDISVDPGYTVIVSSGSGSHGVDRRGQLVVHCAGLVWDPVEDTAFLKDPTGSLVDTFHYKGKRVRKSPSRRGN